MGQLWGMQWIRKRFWGQQILNMSLDPGIFTEHEKKQVKHRNKGKADIDRRTKKKRGKCEVEESSMQSLVIFPGKFLPMPLFFTHRHYVLHCELRLLKRNTKSQRKKNTVQVKDHVFLFFPLCPQWSLTVQRLAKRWVYFDGIEWS